jgi:hypothetical protein
MTACSDGLQNLGALEPEGNCPDVAQNMVAMYLLFPLLLQPAQVPPNSEKGQAATRSRYDWADVIPRAKRLLNSSASRVEAGGSA